jgi:glutaminyl-tRNA synthetase
MSDAPPIDFIRQIVLDDLTSGKHTGVVTRWPPEPNGYLHIGHSKAIWINFSIAAENGGRCNLRFDDTNPTNESTEFVDAQHRDLRWLGYEWGDHSYFASDHFPKLYEYALELIRRGHAFVCDQSSEEIAASRGSLTEPGTPSPHRDRSVDENLDLFERMRAGEFPPGQHVLRAKIDMASPVLPMRDPLIYRVLEAPHHRTGTEWPIYPLYDFAHCLSDAIEGVTHSLCTLEFIDRRPLYEWILNALDLPAPQPRQYEFNPLNFSHTLLSKRFLRRLVEEGLVAGWDDPRLPTLAAYRRRGVPPEAIRSLCAKVGVTRREEATVELSRLDFEIRDRLNKIAPRRMGVLNPLKVVIENYPEEQVEELEAINNPEDESAGTRKVPFSRELWIERDDFLEEPPKKFFRMSPGREVRLRSAYFITCTSVVKDASGEVTELRCSYDPATRGGNSPDGRKVKGTIHWVSAQHSVAAEVRLYDVLFEAEDPMDVPEGTDFTECLNPNALETLTGCQLEPSVAELVDGPTFQLERTGYFCVDPDTTAERLVLNRTVTLRDTWAKLAKKA